MSRFVWGDPLPFELDGQRYCAYRCRCCKQSAIERADGHEVDARECYECYTAALEGGAV